MEEEYRPSELSFVPNVRWLLRLVSDEDGEHLGASHQALEELKIMMEAIQEDVKAVPESTILRALTQGVLYTAACKILFEESGLERWIDSFFGSEKETNADWISGKNGCLDFLIDKGLLDFQESLKPSIVEMIRDSAPFYESIHANIIEVLMQYSVSEVRVDHVMSHIQKHFKADRANSYPYDTDDALMQFFGECIAYAVALSGDARISEWQKRKRDCNELTKFLQDGVAASICILIYTSGIDIDDISFDGDLLENWRLVERIGLKCSSPTPSWRPNEIIRMGKTSSFEKCFQLFASELFLWIDLAEKVPINEIFKCMPKLSTSESAAPYSTSQWLPVNGEIYLLCEIPHEDTFPSPDIQTMTIENSEKMPIIVEQAESALLDTDLPETPDNQSEIERCPSSNAVKRDQEIMFHDFMKQIDEAVDASPSLTESRPLTQRIDSMEPSPLIFSNAAETRSDAIIINEEQAGNNVDAERSKASKSDREKKEVYEESFKNSESEHEIAMRQFLVNLPTFNNAPCPTTIVRESNDFWEKVKRIGEVRNEVEPAKPTKKKKGKNRTTQFQASAKTKNDVDATDASSSDIASAAEISKIKNVANTIAAHMEQLTDALEDISTRPPAKDRRRKLRAQLEIEPAIDRVELPVIQTRNDTVPLTNLEVEPILKLPPLTSTTNLISQQVQDFDLDSMVKSNSQTISEESGTKLGDDNDSTDDSPPCFNLSDIVMSDSDLSESEFYQVSLGPNRKAPIRKIKQNLNRTIESRMSIVTEPRGEDEWTDVSVRYTSASGTSGKKVKLTARLRKHVRRVIRIPSQPLIMETDEREKEASLVEPVSTQEAITPENRVAEMNEDGIKAENEKGTERLPKFKGLVFVPLVSKESLDYLSDDDFQNDKFDLSAYASARRKSPTKPIFVPRPQKAENTADDRIGQHLMDLNDHLPSQFATLGHLPALSYKRKTATNRQIIHNAITHVCLAGGVNQHMKQEALERLSNSTWKHHIIVLKNAQNHTYSALCAWNSQHNHTETIHAMRVPMKNGQFPQRIHEAEIDKYFKYDCGGRRFREIQTGGFGLCVDAVSLKRTAF
ncbi:microtubule-binding calmodulin-regulated spectrin-associated-domain-containing protein [Chytriomyces sp. MP71]|nr:microtubule-binding calmodulin-regulated spectrin-associated-domain-containing protein [Chytriomyces sp. MP71]